MLTRYMVAMLPKDSEQYNGYVFLGVYARNEYHAQIEAESAIPDHYADDEIPAEYFHRYFPKTRERFNSV